MTAITHSSNTTVCQSLHSRHIQRKKVFIFSLKFIFSCYRLCFIVHDSFVTAHEYGGF